MDLPRTFRPLGPRIVGIAVLSLLFLFCAMVWFVGFDAHARSEFTGSQILTLLGVGAMIFAAVYALIRSRITATSSGLTVVNGYRKHTFAWGQVVAARLPSGAPWVTLDLDDGTSCSAMGIQGSDGGHARAQLRALRALLEQYGSVGS
jgi:hypothetical protein